ncbi:MAG TPA: acyl-CoA dehydrogenase family protein [Steroidobacteraceae bacterium]|jgi:alkylation response protein AidB-like acyl-CoA dehydrogenase|nr:acyl-CoA dehydrogenase family protein [Steroidobacteraceae bacterium]
MEFNYSEEQLALQDTLQRFMARDYDFDKRRGFSASPLGYSAEAWRQYAELGLLALPFPKEFDGLGGNAVDIMLVMEQFGQGLVLEPYLSTVVLCGSLMRDAGSAAQKSRFLPQIVQGKSTLALAAYEAAGRYDLSYVECSAQESGGNWILSGRKTVVLDGASADHFLVSARSGGEPGDRDGISLLLVPRDAKGLSVVPYATQWGSRAADLLLEKVSAGSDALIGSAGDALPLIERAVDRAIAALCAEASGIINALNQATLNYLKTRKQFGVAIGTFQALKHKMADMLIAAEQARSMAIIAAVHADSEDAADRRRALSAAKAYVGRAGRLVGQHAVQLHGGMGVVDELIVSHYFKRLTMIDLTFGDADHHLASFSDTLRPGA